MKLPTAEQLKTDARLVVFAFVVLCALAGLWLIAGWLSDPFGFLHRRVERAEHAAVVEHGTAAVAGGQLKAAGDAQVITDKARARDDSTARTREGNHAAILQAKGADAPLDPVLVAAARRGLCRYSLYAGDPDCAAVFAVDPAVVPRPR